MKTIIATILVTLLLVTGLKAGDLTPQQIIKKTDDVVNAPKDQDMSSVMILIDDKGNEKERKTVMLQKGSETRLVRFLTPADQKGIAFLSLPDDVMYLYLPAFHKIRRIASHVKNNNFAGTDFSYDDMSSFKYSEEYNPKLLSTTNEFYSMELIPKKDVQKDYSKLIMTIRKDNFYPVKIEHFDKGGNLWKVLEKKRVEKKGNYWISMEMEMKDLKKNHSTKMITNKIKLDSGLSDKKFTKRNLKKFK